MKTIFIVNPEAGQGKKIKELINSIKDASEKFKKDTEIYITKAVGDAEKFVKNYCKEKGKARFIACGGDGTLSEVLNGAINADGAQIGVMPYGTGNDFCRNFKENSNFKDVCAQLNGEVVKCDAIKYSSEKKEGYCANMFNIGFDCNVADLSTTMKQKPFISGPVAYLLSVFAILIKKKGANLDIELDGNKKHKGKLLLTSIANGSFCGGGIKSNPLAKVNDGYININIVNNMSRLSFLTKLPFYMKGTHPKLKNIEKLISNNKCKKVVITPLDGTMRLCVDGEISEVGKTEFEIIHNAFDFVVPCK